MPTNEEEYGVLIYDVPTENKRLYHRILNRIRRRAIRLNLSVYLITWGMREEMQGIMDDAMAETGQRATVNIVKFDSATNDEVERMAKEGLRRDIRNALERLTAKIAEVREEAGEVSTEYFNKTRDYLQDAEALAGMFGFEQDLSGIIEVARTVWEREWELRQERMRQNSENARRRREALNL